MPDRKGDPTPATRVGLAHVSGNQCAFLSCTRALFDSETRTLTGRICHIKAAEPGGPRYDSEQTDAERRAAANLVYMCAEHALVVDGPDSETIFPADRLAKMKAEHESKAAPIPDALAKTIASLSDVIVQGGSVLVSNQMSGGQMAHSITNIGTMARRISPAAATDIANAIRPFAGEHVNIDAVMGDADSIELGDRLNEVLTSAGWTVDGVSQVVWMPSPKGVILVGTEQQLRAATPLGEALIRAGIRTMGAIDPKAETMSIRVGPDLRGAG